MTDKIVNNRLAGLMGDAVKKPEPEPYRPSEYRKPWWRADDHHYPAPHPRAKMPELPRSLDRRKTSGPLFDWNDGYSDGYRPRPDVDVYRPLDDRIDDLGQPKVRPMMYEPPAKEEVLLGKMSDIGTYLVKSEDVERVARYLKTEVLKALDKTNVVLDDSGHALLHEVMKDVIGQGLILGPDNKYVVVEIE